MLSNKLMWLLILLICFIFSGTALGQEGKIIKVLPEKRLAVINQGFRHGIKEGAILTVYRETSGNVKTIARVKVLKVLRNRSAVQILSRGMKGQVVVGDRIFSPTGGQKWPGAAPRKYRKWAWGAWAGSALFAGVSGFLHYVAEDAYIKYNNATTPDDAVKYRKETEKNLLWRNIFLAGAGLSAITGGTLFFLDGRKSNRVGAVMEQPATREMNAEKTITPGTPRGNSAKTTPRLIQPPQKRNKLAWGFLSLGIACAALSGYWQYEANTDYTRYEKTTIPEVAEKYRKEVQKDWKWRNAFMVGAGLSAVSAGVLFHLDRKKTSLTIEASGNEHSAPEKLVYIAPIFQPNEVGLSIKVCF